MGSNPVSPTIIFLSWSDLESELYRHHRRLLLHHLFHFASLQWSVPLDILGAIAADAAGESIKKSRDKKLEAAKDNPEEYEQILEKIEKGKNDRHKAAKILIILFFVLPIFLGLVNQ